MGVIILFCQFFDAFVFPAQKVAHRFPDRLFLILPVPAKGVQESLVFIRIKPLGIVAGGYLED